MTPPNVLYIAGYGRSGSSLLELALAEVAGVAGRGEASMLQWGSKRGLLCSCGEAVTSCEHWSATVDGLEAVPFNRLHRVAEANRLGAVALIALKRTTIGRAYRRRAEIQLGLTGSNHPELTIDSSKTARSTKHRPRLLATLAGVELTVVHIVRPPQEVIRSLIAGSNWAAQGLVSGTRPRLRAIRAALGWVSANRAATAAAEWVRNGRYLVVPLDDLQADPAATLTSLMEWLGLPASQAQSIVDRGITPDHSLAGNRLRFAGRIDISPNHPRPNPVKFGVITDRVVGVWATRLYRRLTEEGVGRRRSDSVRTESITPER